MTSRSWWLTVIESYPCTSCDAYPGEPCTTSGGRESKEPHADRARAAERCKLCGQRLHNLSESDLCDRHERVRQLELERSITHKRADPEPG